MIQYLQPEYPKYPDTGGGGIIGRIDPDRNLKPTARCGP